MPFIVGAGAWAIALFLLLQGGCSMLPEDPVEPRPLPPPVLAAPQAPTLGGLYSASTAFSLYRDRQPWRPGDIITVRLEERMRSSHASATKITKESDSSLAKPTLLGEVMNEPFGTSANATTDFLGDAETDQSNSLTGTVTVVVTDVLPNGLLWVQGEKRVRINRGNELIKIGGLVRPEDVDGDNAVSSLRLANAELAYTGSGPLANANRVGWFTRFFISPLNPF